MNHPSPSGTPNTPSACIRLHKVEKTYQPSVDAVSVNALRQVSLEVKQGEFVAITGTSGSGKSTLLNMIAGIDTPDSGEIYLLEQPVHNLPDKAMTQFRASHIGFVFQFFNLLDSLTVLENVMLPLQTSAQKPHSKNDQQQRALKLLTQVGLSERVHFFPSQLSGGQMQRAAIARALIHRPAIILSDEPTGNLDSQTGETILNLLIEQCRQHDCTLLMVTHDAHCVSRADRVLTMSDGVLSPC